MIDKNVLKKYVESPVTCSLSETLRVESFLKEYMSYRDMYKETFGGEPIGLTLESNLHQNEWYKNFHKKE